MENTEKKIQIKIHNITVCAILILLLNVSCIAHSNKKELNVNSIINQKDTIMERFNKLLFEKNKIDGECNITLDDGTEIRQWESPPDYYVEQIKKPNSPYEIYKQFYYDNGLLKKSGNRFYNFNIGIWYEYDVIGNKIESQDYEKNYQFSLADLDEKMHKMGIDIMIEKPGVIVKRTSFGKPLYFVTYPINSDNPYDVYELTIDGKTGETLEKKILHRRS